MFECERCGSGYNATYIGVQHCPRCELREGIQAPLSFKAFKLPAALKQPATPSSPPTGRSRTS